MGIVCTKLSNCRVADPPRMKLQRNGFDFIFF